MKKALSLAVLFTLFLYLNARTQPGQKWQRIYEKKHSIKRHNRADQTAAKRDINQARDFLEFHNVLRKRHNSPLMTLNEEMSESAQMYAEKIAKLGQLQHASKEERPGQGENLAYRCSPNLDPDAVVQAVKDWYGEVCDPGYSFNTAPSGGSQTGHFTQVVWKGSAELGLGSAFSKQNNMKCIYVVGRYSPPGNWMGKDAENVQKGSFDQSLCSNTEKLFGMDDIDQTAQTQGTNSNPTNSDLTDQEPKSDLTNSDLTAQTQATNGDSDPPADTETFPTTSDEANVNAAEDDLDGDPAAKSPELSPESNLGQSPDSDRDPDPVDSSQGGASLADPKHQDALNLHNSLRKRHNSPLMTLNEQMSVSAQNYANKIAKMGQLQHASREERPEQGENLAMSCSSNLNPNAHLECVQNWYKEVCNPGYNFDGDNQGGTGHFTQLVWKGSSDLGIGISYIKQNGMQCIYVVGRYKDAGNFIGRYKTNIQKGSFDPSMCKSDQTLFNFDDIGGTPSASQNTPNSGTNPGSATNNPGEVPNQSTTNNKPSTNVPVTNQEELGGKGKSTSDPKHQGALDLHNSLRKRHNSPPMTLNEEMSRSAQMYAEKIAKLGQLQHASREERSEQGENLSMSCSSKLKPNAHLEGVQNWYNEVCEPGYNFNGDNQGGTGHFTQLVWEESNELGVGMAYIDKNGMQCIYVVGRYKPAGNFIGKYKENVHKGSFDAQTNCQDVKSRRHFDTDPTALNKNHTVFQQHEEALLANDSRAESKAAVEFLKSKDVQAYLSLKEMIKQQAKEAGIESDVEKIWKE